MSDITPAHGKTETFYNYDGAVQPMLFFDSSVRTFDAADSNGGWIPNRPQDADTRRVVGTNEPPFPVRFNWTRGGLRGLDFGAPDVDTGQPRN